VNALDCVPLPWVKGRIPQLTEGQKMKVDEVKQLTNKSFEELVAALESGHSEMLTAYLKTMSRFSKYSLNYLFLIGRQRLDARRFKNGSMQSKREKVDGLSSAGRCPL
jgi:hypothetical protein